MAILAWETKCVGKMPLVYLFSKKEMAKTIVTYGIVIYGKWFLFDWPFVKTYASIDTT